MRRTMSIALVVLAAGCGSMRDTVTLESPGAPLRLSRVVLYQNGLAHFERRGRADSGTIDLLVPAAQVDDVLRTLTVVDGADAAITGVRMLPAQRDDDVTLRVGLATGGARDLRITYVTELPGFRPTYRLVVGDDGHVHVQGLAVVDNPTSEPWHDVGLTLSTEVPLSFRFDVREGRHAFRPRFGPDGHLVQEASVENPSAAIAMNAIPLSNGLSDVNVAYGMAQRDQPEMSNRAGNMIQRTVNDVPAPNPSPPASANPSASNALLAFEQRPEESGGVFGSVSGFDLGRGESGLVPFVDRSTDGELALLFKPSPGGALSRTHPYRAVLFRNPTRAPLLTGPVAIYAGDRFVGDGVTGTVAARAHAFVPYALERSVTVQDTVEQTEDEVRATGLAGGVLSVELRSVHRHRFAITTTLPVHERIFVFAPAMEGFEPRALPEGAIRTSQGYFLPVHLDDDRTATVTFDLLRRATTRVNIAADPDHTYVPALLLLLQESPDVARLREITDRLTAIDEELSTLDEDLRVERGALDERRSALDALRTVSSGGAIRQQLAQAVAQGVGRIDALTRRSSELHAEQISLEQEWYGRLRALTVGGASVR